MVEGCKSSNQISIQIIISNSFFLVYATQIHFYKSFPQKLKVIWAPHVLSRMYFTNQERSIFILSGKKKKARTKLKCNATIRFTHFQCRIMIENTIRNWNNPSHLKMRLALCCAFHKTEIKSESRYYLSCDILSNFIIMQKSSMIV